MHHAVIKLHLHTLRLYIYERKYDDMACAMRHYNIGMFKKVNEECKMCSGRVQRYLTRVRAPHAIFVDRCDVMLLAICRHNRNAYIDFCFS